MGWRYKILKLNLRKKNLFFLFLRRIGFTLVSSAKQNIVADTANLFISISI